MEMDSSRTFKTEKFCDTGKLFAAYQRKHFCDVILIAGEKRIPTHKIILYAGNEYFAAMFTMDVKERSQLEITMNEVDGDILKKLVEYCYTGQITIDRDNVEEIAKAANMLRFTKVAENCTEYYSEVLCVSNCLRIWEAAERRNAIQLKETAFSFVLNNFDEVSYGDEFCELNEQQLAVLLAHDELNVSAEEDVLKALMQWVKYDIENRKQSLGALLECVRFKLIKDAFMDEVNQQCIELNCGELYPPIVLRRSSEDGIEVPRSPKLPIHLVSGTDSGVKLDKYCERQNSWKNVKTIDLKIEQSAVIYREGKLIFIGNEHAQGERISTVNILEAVSRARTQFNSLYIN